MQCVLTGPGSLRLSSCLPPERIRIDQLNVPSLVFDIFANRAHHDMHPVFRQFFSVCGARDREETSWPDALLSCGVRARSSAP